MTGRPAASALARLKAAQGNVTNLRHQAVRIEDDFNRRFLGWLDESLNRLAHLCLLEA